MSPLSSSKLTDTAHSRASVAIKVSTFMFTPTPTALRDVTITSPPDASIDSITDDSGTPYPTGLRDVAMTLPPGENNSSTTGGSDILF